MTPIPKVKLADCVDLLPGFAFKSQQFTDEPGDIPLVKGENVSQGCVLWDISKRWPSLDWPNLEKFQLRLGDVIVAMDRPWVPAGLKWAYIRREHPKALLVQRCARLRSNTPRLDQDFLRFVIGAPGFEGYVKPITTGVNVPHISGKQILDYEFHLPPLPVQQRIAGILSAYDDLIENNQRRVKILQSIACALYREWFVLFRFPGHENQLRIESRLGAIPQGWEVKKLGDVAEVNRAQIGARTTLEEIQYIDISSVSPGQIDFVTTYALSDAPGRARRVVQHGDVLWSCVRPNRRSHAQVMCPELNTIASTGFAVLTATKVPFTFLYFATTTDDFVAYLTNNATGAAYPAVTAPTFERAELVIPPAPLLKKFGDVSIPMAEQIHTLQRQIQNLRRTRDLLIPRLLSGQIDVSAEGPELPASEVTAPLPSPATKGPLLQVKDAIALRKAPPAIDNTDREDVLCTIRRVFSDGTIRDRDTAIRDIAYALGYQRTGSRIMEVLSTDFLTAVRRGIVVNEQGYYRLGFSSFSDCTRDSMKNTFRSAIGRTWISRDDAIRAFARWVGFARVGEVINQTARSLINGLIREGRLETDGPDLIRKV